MKLSEMIRDMQQLASTMDADPEVILFDRFGDREMKLDPDSDTFDFQIMRGDAQIVIEFD